MNRGYCDHIVGQLSDWAPVRARGMFGGFGLYRGELMFGLIDSQDAFYMKVDDSNRPDYEAAGMGPFTPDMPSGRTTSMMSYWQVPEDVIDDAETLAQWAEKAHDAAVRSKSAPKKVRAKKPAKA